MVKGLVWVGMMSLTLGPWSAAARQVDVLDPMRGNVTRSGLQTLLASWEAAAASTAYSAGLRDRARQEAEQIRERLEEGDFRVGDRIHLTVEQEATLSDTFVVDTARVITLPDVGRISLVGVLRSELQTYMTDQLSRYIRNPVVQTRTVIRLTVVGGGRPGFYSFPSEILFTDALMQGAGGVPIDQSGNFDFTVERDGVEIWAGDRMQEAVRNGLTLDQMSLRQGDQIHIPQQQSGGGGAGRGTFSNFRSYRLIGFLIGIPFSLFGIRSLLRN